ncbi:hypothetical protein [Streptomyces sp. Root369]|nr:hypothetical protein [Streptomyces sp. Root369]
MGEPRNLPVGLAEFAALQIAVQIRRDELAVDGDGDVEAAEIDPFVTEPQ